MSEFVSRRIAPPEGFDEYEELEFRGYPGGRARFYGVGEEDRLKSVKNDIGWQALENDLPNKPGWGNAIWQDGNSKREVEVIGVLERDSSTSEEIFKVKDKQTGGIEGVKRSYLEFEDDRDEKDTNDTAKDEEIAALREELRQANERLSRLDRLEARLGQLIVALETAGVAIPPEPGEEAEDDTPPPAVAPPAPAADVPPPPAPADNEPPENRSRWQRAKDWGSGRGFITWWNTRRTPFRYRDDVFERDGRYYRRVPGDAVITENVPDGGYAIHEDEYDEFYEEDVNETRRRRLFVAAGIVGAFILGALLANRGKHYGIDHDQFNQIIHNQNVHDHNLTVLENKHHVQEMQKLDHLSHQMTVNNHIDGANHHLLEKLWHHELHEHGKEFSGFHTDSFYGRTPHEAVRHMFGVIGDNNIHVHGLTEHKINAITDSMIRDHWQVASGVGPNHQQNIVDVSRDWADGRTQNWNASALQGLEIRNGSSVESWHRFMRLAERNGVRFTVNT